MQLFFLDQDFDIKTIYILLKGLVNVYISNINIKKIYSNRTTSEIYVVKLWFWKNICVFISNSFCIHVLSNLNVAVFLEIEHFQLHSKRQHRSVATMSSAMFRMNNHGTWHIIYITLSFWAAFKTGKLVLKRGIIYLHFWILNETLTS